MINFILELLLEQVLKSGKVIDIIVKPFVSMILTPGNEQKLVDLFEELDEKLIDSIENIAPETHKEVQSALIRVFGKFQAKVED